MDLIAAIIYVLYNVCFYGIVNMRHAHQHYIRYQILDTFLHFSTCIKYSSIERHEHAEIEWICWIKDNIVQKHHIYYIVLYSERVQVQYLSMLYLGQVCHIPLVLLHII